MTRWKYDAEPNHALVPDRIPVIPVCPYYGYLVGLSKYSAHQPTAAEVRLLVSFTRYDRDSWHTSSERERFDTEPFDIHIGTNTVIFHKYGNGSWAYRRRSWPVERLYPSQRRVQSRGPLPLVRLMDMIHEGVFEESWVHWKSMHPEVFGGSTWTG